jgi:amino acid transporter
MKTSALFRAEGTTPVAMRRAVSLLDGRGDLAEGLGYTLKRRLLGRPLVNEQLGEQRLSKPLALGVLAPDGISSSAYGTEEILIELLKAGLAVTAFTLILPLTGVVLFVMALVVLSYREVVTVYTRAGGSYVVARDNFGPRMAQVAAVALLIDYVVTVAVQVAAGTAAVASAWSAINSPLKITVISIVIVLLMCYGNLRGIREAGRLFAVPTYLFSGAVIIMIVTGLIREIAGSLPHYPYPRPGQYGDHVSHSTSGLIAFGLVFVLLRAFANGGSSLTGIEAVSNAVSAFRPPEGKNARKVLVTEGLILGSLVAGISWLAHSTHAAPFVSGVPTVISQETKIVFGNTGFGTFMYILVQAATALILYTGGNTSFNGFPFLASFVAEDAFLPRWLTKRGHRLVFSNGIVVLAVLSCALLAAVGANVNNLVPFYALGVFTAFTMAGFGMARYHHRMRESGWRRRLVINFSAGVTSAVVVLIFVVVKFTEGAWLVVILFALGVPALIRLNREYQMEAGVLARIGSRPKPPEPPTYSRRTVFVFVDSFDLATISALRYARSLRPTTLHAVHFVIDNTQADILRQDWVRANTGIVLDFVDCADRRLARCAAELVSAEAELPGVGVTAILPRRTYSTILGRLLHDRTADKIAGAVSRIPYAVATIVPFDVQNRVQAIWGRRAAADQRQPVPQPGTKPGAPKLAAVSDAPEETKEGAGAKDSAGAKDRLSAKDEAGAKATKPAAARPVRPTVPPMPAEPAGDARPGADAKSARPPKPAGPTKPTGPVKPAEPVKAGGPAVPAQGADSAQAAGDGDDVQPDEQAAAADAAHMADAAAAVADAATSDAAPAPDGSQYDKPVPPPGVQPMGSLTKPGKVTVEGRVYAVEIRPVERNTVLAAEIADSTGHLTALFYGRSHITGLDCGARVRFRGQVGMRPDGPVMINPAYELVAPGAPGPPRGGDPGQGGTPPDSPPPRGSARPRPSRRRKGQ